MLRNISADVRRNAGTFSLRHKVTVARGGGGCSGPWEAGDEDFGSARCRVSGDEAVGRGLLSVWKVMAPIESFLFPSQAFLASRFARLALSPREGCHCMGYFGKSLLGDDLNPTSML